MRFFELFIGALSAKSAYRYMRRERQGLGLAYSFVLVALSATIFVIFMLAMTHAFFFASHNGKKPLFDDALTQIAAQLPDATVADGTLSIAGAQPRYVKLHFDTATKSVEFTLLTIDTTGTVTHENMRTPMLITATEVIGRSEEKIEIRKIRDLLPPDLPPTTYTHAQITAIGDGIVIWVHENMVKIMVVLALALWCSITAVLYVLRIIMLVALAFAGLLIARASRAPLDYGASMRLAALAYTPVAVLEVVLAVGAIVMPPIALFCLGAIMQILAIRISSEA